MNVEKGDSLKSETIVGFLWLFTGSGFQSVLKIIVLSILARLVSPYEFGVIGIALIVIGFSRIFSQMGMGPAIVQRKVLTNSHIRTAFTSSLVFGTLLTLLLYFFAPLISSFFEMSELTKVIKFIAFIFIIDSFIVVSKSLLQRKIKLKLYALSEIISYAVGYGFVAVIFAYFNYGVWALVYGQLGRAIIHSFIVSYLEPHSLKPYWNRRAFKELLYFGGGFTIAKIANYFAGKGDNLIVGKLLGGDALGYYSRAYQIMVAPVNLIGSSLNNALFPAMSSVQNDKKKLQKAYLKSIEMVGLVSLSVSAIIVINAREIVFIFLGGAWTEVIIPLQILTAGMIFRMSYKISDSLARAIGVVYQRAWRQIAYTITIFIGAYLGHLSGITGVALGVIIAITINFLLMAHLSIKKLNLTWKIFFLKHLKSIYLTCFVGLTSYLVLSFLRFKIENILLREVTFIILLSGIFIPIIYKLRRFLNIEEEIHKLIKYIKKKYN